MTTLSNQISIESDLSKTFDFLANLENMPLWNYYILEVRKTQEDIYEVKRKNDEQTFRLLEVEPNEKILIQIKSSKLISVTREMKFHFEKKVLLLDNIKISSILPGFVERYAAKKIQEAMGDNLGKLKELLETGQTILQDGRTKTFN